MTEKRYVVKGNWIEDRCIGKLLNIDFNTITDAVLCCDLLNDIENKKAEYGKIASKYLEENEQLKKFESTGEHIRLSINIETGELQRHIYATGQWFGDFDRVLVKNWIDEDNYQRFVDRVIEVYNNEFKKELQE